MKPGKIIPLNGASSAGKTCLLRALQDELPEPYLEAGLDKFIWMLSGATWTGRCGMRSWAGW